MSNVHRESAASGNLVFKRYELAVARQCSKAFKISRSFSVLLGEIQKKNSRYENIKIIKGMVKIK
jgi:hypothetical protein